MSTSTLALLLGAFGFRRKIEPPPLPPVAQPVTEIQQWRQPKRPERADPRGRKPVATVKVVQEFVNWMRAQDCYGYWLVEEVDTYISIFCEQQGWVEPHPYDARSRLTEVPGVQRGRWSINTAPEFYDVRIRTTLVRPTLYRISREPPRNCGRHDDFHDVAIVSADVVPLTRHHRDTKQGKGGPNKKRKLTPQDSRVRNRGNREIQEAA